MKLTFLYHPVKDLQQSLAFYRDVLGWDEAWREGDVTVAMQIPGSEVQVMLDASDNAASAVASGFYEVTNVDEFYERHRDDAVFVESPIDLPPIRYASFTDPAGHLFRLYHNMDEGDGTG